MMIFWVVVAVLIAVALAFLLPPLLRLRPRKAAALRSATNVAVYRDQLRELEQDLAAGVMTRETYDDARREVERRLLDDVAEPEPEAPPVTGAGRNAAVVIAATVPVLAVLIYMAVGTPQALNVNVAASGEAAPHSVDSEQIRSMVERLAQRLEQNPDDAQGWVMLARSRMAIGQFPEAAQAFKSALAHAKPDANLLADYADALAMAQGKRLDGEPEKLIKQALEIDPNHVKALALAGSVAFEQKRYGEAVSYWERIAKQAPADSELVQQVNASIAEARDLSAKAGKPLAAARAEAGTPSGGRQASASVSGVVELSPSFKSRVAPTDTLFVFARAVEGSHMPLAIMRAQAKDLPLRFTLDETSAMSPDKSLATQKQVIVVARVSKSGSATGGAGDLEGSSKPVAVGTKGLALRIDSEVR